MTSSITQMVSTHTTYTRTYLETQVEVGAHGALESEGDVAAAVAAVVALSVV